MGIGRTIGLRTENDVVVFGQQPMPTTPFQSTKTRPGLEYRSTVVCLTHYHEMFGNISF